MKKKRDSRKKMLTILLCWALCAANIMPTSMTVWANEQAPESIVSYDNISEITNEGNRENNDPDDTSSEENTGADTDEEDSVPGEDEDDVTEEDEIVEIDETEVEAATAVNADGDTSGTYTEDGSATEWMIDGNGVLTVTGTGEVRASGEEVPWYEHCDKIITAKVSVTGMTDASGLFKDCSNLESVEFLSGWNTDKVTDMSNMFRGCSSLTELDLRNWHFNRLTKADDMLSGCDRLEIIYLSAYISNYGDYMPIDLPVSGDDVWYRSEGGNALSKLPANLYSSQLMLIKNRPVVFGNFYENTMWVLFEDGELIVTGTGEVKKDRYDAPWKSLGRDIKSAKITVSGMKDASFLFSGCSNLVSVDLSEFDTDNIQYMQGMFNNCSSLKTLDLRGINTAAVVDMQNMFYDCSNLTDLDLNGFDTGMVTNMSSMFYNCRSLENLSLSSFDTGKVTNASNMLSNCQSLEDIDAPLNLKVDVDLPTGGSGSNIWCRNDTGAVITRLPQGEKESIRIFKNKAIKYGGTYTNAKDGSNTVWMIDENGKLTVTGTGEVRETVTFSNGTVSPLAVPWYNYRSEIKAAEISVQGMKNAHELFRDCSNLESIDVSKFDTSRVTDMSSMFSGCSKLRKLDLSGWSNDQVTDMSYMFYNCSSLEELDLSGFKTDQVTDMSSMFSSCSKLTKLDLSGWSNDHVTDMSRMFCECRSLTDLNLSNFRTASVTTMEGMFLACHQLKTLDVSSFDTRNVKDMSHMFSCARLEELDVSGFDTRNVTNMRSMFNCDSLTELDVSRFDTGNVTDMNRMFYCCQSLTTLDVSNFDTSGVTDMGLMFYMCLDLKELTLDVSKFNTGNVTDMSYMFYVCESLTELNVSGFDTGKVKNTERMFCECSSLTELDVSSFNTSNVTNMELMFAYCENLKELDLSGFNTGNVTNVIRVFDKSNKLEVIYAPLHLKETVNLPKAKSSDVWYRADTGKTVTQLPKNLTKSILLTRNKKVVISDPYISAVKTRTTYAVGDELDIDDITVTYFNGEGTIRKLTEGFDVDTNAIDMSVPGKKELLITYVVPDTQTDKNPDGIKLETTIELTITLGLTSTNTTITLDMDEASVVYSGYPQRPVPTVTVNMEGKATGLSGEDYEVAYTDNINVGTATVTITGTGDIYSGTVSKDFVITKKPLTVRVKDMNLAQGEQVPEKFDYEVDGIVPADMPAKADGLPIKVSYSFKDKKSGGAVSREEISEADEGTVYYVIPGVSFTDAGYGENYNVNTAEADIRGILTITKERVEYVVTFDMMGHGTDIDPITGITAGSLISESAVPEAEGYVFGGWYKDKTFAAKQKWNFATDTVQADTTLYACWIKKGEEGYSGEQFSIQDIRDQTYTGSAIKPTVYVYAADGVTLLKSGKDYTIKYAANTNAGEAQVIIIGKGNYSGTITKTFQIQPAKISADDGNVAAGFTLKYSDQLVTNAKKDQNPFSSLKYKKAMKLGTDYKITLSAGDDVQHVAGAAEADWIESGESATTGYVEKTKKYTAPVIPKGYYGTFTMKVEGAGNYESSFTKDVVVMDKDHLMKNASISLGKNQKSRAYMDGWEVTLTPGYMVVNGKTKEYYAAGKPEKYTNANDIFMVSVKEGKSTKYLRADEGDFTVSYTNNTAVGTATMTVTGNPDRGYYGSKSVTFKITGTAFNTKNVIISTYDAKKMTMDQSDGCFMPSMEYTGSAITQNGVILKPKATADKQDPDPLVYGTHYTISYSNNIKKGTATMTFKAKPESGYTGSFKKTFKITAQSLLDANFKEGSVEVKASNPAKNTRSMEWNGTPATYSKNGATLSFVMQNDAGMELKQGTDYTVSYKNNKTVTVGKDGIKNLPTLTIKGKGNYVGTLTVTFPIDKADIADAFESGTLKVSASSVARKSNMQFKDFKFKILDGKATLSMGVGKDYTLDMENCGPETIKAYADALENGDGDLTEPKVTVIGADTNYSGSKELSLADYIYVTKLTSSNLYIIVDEDNPEDITYTGAVGDDKKIRQAKPGVTVYYGDAAAVKAAKKLKKEIFLEDPESYKLTELTQKPGEEAGGDGNYTVTYGANNAAGKNKGSVTITGIGRYGGSVTVKFTILQRGVIIP